MKRSHLSCLTKRFTPRNPFKADGPVTVTQHTVLHPLMDLKISLLHDSVYPFTLQVSDKLCLVALKENNGLVSHESSDNESHISRLGYCFVSRHVKPVSKLHRQQPVYCSSHPPEGKVTWTSAACVCNKTLKSLQFLPVTWMLEQAQ